MSEDNINHGMLIERVNNIQENLRELVETNKQVRNEVNTLCMSLNTKVTVLETKSTIVNRILWFVGTVAVGGLINQVIQGV